MPSYAYGKYHTGIRFHKWDGGALRVQLSDCLKRLFAHAAHEATEHLVREAPTASVRSLDPDPNGLRAFTPVGTDSEGLQRRRGNGCTPLPAPAPAAH